jgi:hypothetical protein
LNEEKEQLEASCSNLTSDLEELKTNQYKPRFEKQLSWSTTSSMDLERATSPANAYDENSNTMSFHQRSLTDSTSYNKATDSVYLITKQNPRTIRNSRTSSPSMDVDERNRYIQTPSGLTTIRTGKDPDTYSMEDQDLATPLPSDQKQFSSNINNSSSRNSMNNLFSTPQSNISISSASKRRLQYGDQGKVCYLINKAYQRQR